jgi:predicted secreted protein
MKKVNDKLKATVGLRASRVSFANTALETRQASNDFWKWREI